MALSTLDDLGWAHLKFSAKDTIPKAARDTKSVLVVGKVVLEMVLLELLVVRGQPAGVSNAVLKTLAGNLLLMVQKVVGHVVARVPENAAAVGSQRSGPVPEDNGMCKFPEGCGKRDEKCRWHDESVLVHREIMVDTVEEEVQCDTNTVIWQMPVRC
jgi:hypothetical protein